METGIGIAIAGVSISAAAVVVTIIKTKPANGNGHARSCPLHSGIEATLVYLKDCMGTVQEDIKDILQKLGG